jgi:hypothetical protein
MISLNDLNKAIILYQSSPYSTKLEVMMNYYNSLNDINRVIDDACFGRSIDEDGFQIISDHYWNTFQIYKDDDRIINRISGRNKSNWLEWTYKIRKDILDSKNNIVKCNHFNEIYSIIYKITEKHNEFAELYSYDVSLRIGAKLKLMPDNVYLHAGAKRGYYSIFVRDDSPIVGKDIFVKKSKKFSSLEPYQIENFLCVAKVQKWI